MPIDVRCPGCSASFPVTESGRTFKVECPYCDQQFTAPLAGSAAPAKPVPAKAKPPARRRRDEDDDDDDGGRGRKKKNVSGGSPVLVLVVAGLGLLFVLGGLGLTAYLIFSGNDKEAETAQATKPGGTPNNAAPNTPQPQVSPKANTPKNATPKNSIPKNDTPDDVPPKNNPPKNNPFRNNPPKFDPFPPQGGEAFALKPEAGVPVKIEPAKLTGLTMTVDLPGKAGAVKVGGGGRFLVMHFPAEKQLAVFDVNALKVGKPIDVPADALFAAGMNKAVVVSPQEKTTRVYTLPDLAADGEGAAPPTQPGRGLLDLAMGSATNGPLFVATFPEISLFDLKTLARVDGSAQFGPPGGVPIHPGVAVRAAANGKVFGAQWRDHGAGAYTEKDGQWAGTPLEGGAAYLSADGETAYGPGVIAGADGQQIGQKIGGFGKGVWFVPAVHGDYFLRLNELKEGDAFNSRQSLTATVHADRNPEKSLANLGKLPEAEGVVEWPFGQVAQPLDRCVFLIPDAGVLAILSPKTPDKLVLRKVTIK